MTSIKKNYIYNLVYQIFLIIVPILVTPYISRILLSDGIGKYSYTSSIVSYFSLFASFGFTTYGQRVIARYKNDQYNQSLSFWEIFLCKIGTCMISILVYVMFIVFEIFGENYTDLFWIQLITLIASIFDINFLFYGNEDFGRITIRNIILKFVSIVLIFLFIKKHDDLYLYVLIQVGFTLMCNISIWLCLKSCLVKIKIKDLNIKKHIKPSLLLFLPSIASSIYTMLDRTLIGAITGIDSNVGNYESAEKIVRLCLTVITALTTVYVPRNSALFENNNHDLIRKNTLTIVKYVWLIGVPMTLGIFAISQNLVPWYLGEEYGESNLNAVIYLMKFLSPIILLIGMGTVFGTTILIPTNKESKLLIATITAAIINFVLNIIFIYFFGTIGACIATLSAETVCLIMELIFSKDYISFKDVLISSVKPVIAGVIMFVPCFALSETLDSSIINSVIIIIVGVLVYFISLILLRENVIYEIIERLWKKVKRKK